MSAKMRRRRRHDRLKRVRTERREDMLFFTRGTFPRSATACATCPCGARAFARAGGDIYDFADAHAYCSWSSEEYDGWQDVPHPEPTLTEEER